MRNEEWEIWESWYNDSFSKLSGVWDIACIGNVTKFKHDSDIHTSGID